MSSVDEKELEKATNKEEALEELKSIIDTLNFGFLGSETGTRTFISDKGLGSLNKKDILKKLIEYRKRFFDQDKTAEKKAKEEAKKAFDGKYPEFSQDGRVQDLNSQTIYCLSDDILDLDVYKNSDLEIVRH